MKYFYQTWLGRLVSLSIIGIIFAVVFNITDKDIFYHLCVGAFSLVGAFILFLIGYALYNVFKK